MGFSLILLVVVCAYYFYRDLRLHLTTKVVKLPDIVIHDVKVDKVINGRRWRLRSPRMETKNNVLYGDNLDVNIIEEDGTESHIFAKKGEFSRNNNDLKLTDANGTMVSGEKKYDMKTGNAEYNAKDEVWFFSNKLSLTDHETTVTGESGSFNTKSGDCSMKQGGKISWEEE